MTKKEYLNNYFKKVTAPKKMQQIQNVMDNSTYNTDNLYSFYTTFSQAKANALRRCNDLCWNLDGFSQRIINANGWAFTYGFEFMDDNGVLCNAYITKDNTIYCQAV